MTRSAICSQRLQNQRLVGGAWQTPAEVVRSLGAVQAQDYGSAQWAIAQRTPGLTGAELERAFAEGTFLRTHVLRPTWHFVAPEDIRWLLALTAPRVHALNSYQYRRLELDDALFGRSNAALAGALQGGRQLTRAELAGVLEAIGISASGLRLAYLVMRAELDAIVCSGPRRGKQFTYALLAERAPNARRLSRDEALAELTRRYFTSHGPALVQDYAWWSGLTVTEAKAGLELVGPHLTHASIDGKRYWFAHPSAREPEGSSTVHLLPNYDEYLIAYRDYSPVFDSSRFPAAASRDGVLGGHLLVVDGQVAGGWRRTIRKEGVLIEIRPRAPLSSAAREDLQTAAERYGRFVERPVAISFR
jgi:hypothetical protein